MIERSGAAGQSERDLYEMVEEFFRTGFATDNALITEAVRRMLAAGGKRLRPRFTLLAAEAMGANAADHLALAAYMELIHVATLIHDDVVDNAETRRGVNATAVDFGNRISVLAGDYLFAWIFANVTAGYPAPVPHILSATLASICDGEVLQLRALGNLDHSVAEYEEIARKKTGALFAASAECGAIMGDGPPLRVRALHDFGMYYGVAFQMMDDLLDVTATEAMLGKPVGNDLRERKMTIPIVLGLQTGDAAFRTRLTAFYASERAADEAAPIAALIADLTRIGAVERTRQAIAAYVERAKMALAPVGTHPARAELSALADRLTSG